jgi:hypothetical protein
VNSGWKDQRKVVGSRMGDIGVVVMRSLATPSGIDFESEIVIGIERSELSPG